MITEWSTWSSDVASGTRIRTRYHVVELDSRTIGELVLALSSFDDSWAFSVIDEYYDEVASESIGTVLAVEEVDTQPMSAAEVDEAAGADKCYACFANSQQRSRQ